VNEAVRNRPLGDRHLALPTARIRILTVSACGKS
jgi:hypothetical protein